MVLGVLVRACSKGADGETAFKPISFGLGCGTKGTTRRTRAQSGLMASLLAACPDYSKESLKKIEQSKDEKHFNSDRFPCSIFCGTAGMTPIYYSTHSYLPRPELHLPVAVCDATSVIKAANSPCCIFLFLDL